VIEAGTLAAGQRREYPAGTVARMVIGNASAAHLRVGGELQDLAAFQRANVARFTVSSDGRLQPAAD
jgi:cytoskeleton protein RodZ